jgi:hypothetical protein
MDSREIRGSNAHDGRSAELPTLIRACRGLLFGFRPNAINAIIVSREPCIVA